MNTRTLSITLPDDAREHWLPFCGLWNFCFYHDYRLSLRATRRGFSLSLRDTDMEEDAELRLLRASAEQIVLRLFCDGLSGRLCLYPHAAGNALVVEFTDTDHYTRCAPQEVAASHEYVCCPEEGLPGWVFGTWVETDGFQFLRLRRGDEDKAFCLSLWTDWGAQPPTISRRSFRRLLDITAAGANSIELVWQGADTLNRRLVATLLMDAAQQRLLLRFTRRLLAERV